MPTSYELEALGVELMEKAAELDELIIPVVSTTPNHGQP